MTTRASDYMNRSQVMKTVDRKLLHYIASAAYHFRQAEEYLDDYRELANVSYYKGLRKDWPDMARLYKQLAQADLQAARLYKQLAQADLQAARYLIDDMADLELIDGTDWQTIKHWLVWMGYPAEDRYD